MSQLREYIEKHPSETQRMLGIDYDQLIQLITQAERERVERELKKVKASQSTMLEIAKETGYGSGNYGG